jgi:hypothetical protein
MSRGEETAGPSATLGRDDKLAWKSNLRRKKFSFTNKIVIPTESPSKTSTRLRQNHDPHPEPIIACFSTERKRSGGTCCFFSSAHEIPHYKMARLSGLQSDATLTGAASDRAAALILMLHTALLLKANKVPPSAVTCSLVA